jgi:AraC-like DNA-binding protein
MARTGRRKPGEPTAFAEYLEGLRHPALRRIAEAALRHGFSVRRLASVAGRDEASVRRTFDADRTPQRTTIDALARAVGLYPVRLHAELDDLTSDETESAFNEAMRFARLVTFKVPNEAAIERLVNAYRAVSPQARNEGARAWVLAGDERSTEQRLLRFIEALNPADSSELLAFFPERAGGDAMLWMIASYYRDLGFDDDEVRRLLSPTLKALRRRDHTRLDAMLELARNHPIDPIDLEEPRT